MELRSRLNRALPEWLPFYHLGIVSRSGSFDGSDDHPMAWADLEAEGRRAFAISIRGGERDGTLLLLVDRERDPSVYAEIVNVLASRVADELHAMPSPPRLLAPRGAERLLRATPGSVAWFEYLHDLGAEKVALEVAFAADPQGEARHV